VAESPWRSQLSQCCGNGSRFLDVLHYPLFLRLQVPAAAQQLTQVLSKLRHTFVVADATLPDCPLVYASES